MRPVAAVVGDQFVPGTMLGKYELLATIGTGGMASVILARQRGPAGFEKVVVIKVVHPHMAQDQVAVNMLLDEAKVASQIDHQNVVHTYELGEAGGTFYIVMEYLAGESLAQVIKAARAGARPAFDPYLAARIVADAAAGLHHAHELKDFSGTPLEVVHRDVSPGNIVVLYNGAVKVVDFGIAKAHGRVTSTQDGELKGKYGYMSPEQIKNEPLDRRSDVFSLGVVLWEALAQKRLFQADNVAAILMQILGGERFPPSQFRPGVPPALDAITLAALHPDPRGRFQTAEDMKRALEDAIWQTRFGPSEISAHMTALFADRMEQRRGLLARATREQLTQGDLATFGTAFKDPTSTVESRGAIRAPTAIPVAGPPPAAPIAPPSERRSNKRIAIILALGVIAGVAAGVVVGFGGDDKPAKLEVVASTPGGESTIARAVNGNGDQDGSANETPEPTVREPTVTPTLPTVPPVTVSSPEATKPEATKPDKPDKPEATKPETTKPDKPEATPRTRPEVKPVPETRPDPDEDAAEPRDSKPDQRSGTEALLTKKATEQYLAGNFGAAESLYKQALGSNRGYAPAHKGLGFLYQRTGNKAKAIESLRTYLKLVPSAKDADSVKKRLEQLGGA